MVYSSTALLHISKSSGQGAAGSGYQFMYLKKHIMTLCIALIPAFIFYSMKPLTLKRLAYPALFISILLLLALFIPGLGVKINGARRWLMLWPSTFQPGEVAKFAVVLYLASYLSSEGYRRDSFKDYMKPLLVLLPFQVLLLLQPDFGGAFILAAITFLMLFLSGVPARFLLITASALLPVVVKLIMEPYRLKRVMAFRDPWSDQYGSGFQLVQSFIALGSGGLKGVGIGQSRQKLSFLPEVNTDFIFSLIGEELGFAGVSVVLILFLLFFIRGMKIAGRTEDRFLYYLTFGLTILVTVQALMNIAVVTGLVPPKGLPLPFISYGGSSLLVNFIVLGTLLSISKAVTCTACYGERPHDGREAAIRRRAKLRARRVRKSRIPGIGGAGA